MAIAAGMAVFPKENPLPGSQGEFSFDDRDREGSRGQRSLDMRRHIVGAFGGMLVERVLLGDQPVHPLFQIAQDGRVGIFLNREAGRGMRDVDRTQTFLLPSGFD